MALFNFRPATPQEREQKAIEEARKQYAMLLGQAPTMNNFLPQEGPPEPMIRMTPQEGPVRPGEDLGYLEQRVMGNALPPLRNVVSQGSGLLAAMPPQEPGQVSPQELLLRTAGMAGEVGPNLLRVAKEGLLSGQETGPFGGTGINAQAYNQAIKYNKAVQSGMTPSPTDEMAYNLAYQQLSKPSRYIDASGQQVEVPGMDMTGFAVPKGLEGAQKKLGAKKPMAAESAGKLAMMDVAKYGISVAEPILFKGEDINEKAIKEMYAIDMFGPSAALMSSEGQKLYNAFEYGKQAITRTETGAAMPPSEVRNTAKRFMPVPWDNKDTVKQKWKAYNMFIDNTSKYLDPNNLNADAIYNKVVADLKSAPTETKVRKYNPKTGKIE